MKVIICGGRDLHPTIYEIQEAVDASGFKVTELVHGDAKGVDSSAGKWAHRIQVACKAASEAGLMHPYEDHWLLTRAFPIPDWVWKHMGKSAGPIRNQHMAWYADAVIAFPGGRGTQNMIETAKREGLAVYEHPYEIDESSAQEESP